MSFSIRQTSSSFHRIILSNLNKLNTNYLVNKQQKKWFYTTAAVMTSSSAVSMASPSTPSFSSSSSSSSSSPSSTPRQTPTFSLSGRTALITGSTSGIGLGIANILASYGCNIILNGFGNINDINQIKNQLISKYNIQVTYSNADMSKPEEIKKMIQEAVQQFGAVDILVNNAGIQHVSPIESFPAEKWNQIIDINLNSNYYTTSSVLPIMHKNKWGRIINIASAHGKVGSAGKSAYVASKHAVVGMTKVIALENANKGVTCNAICPGWVLTPLVQKQIDDRAAANGRTPQEEKNILLGEKQPMLEFTTPESLGGLVAFLCGPHSNTITGTTISMDGGWTAQ